MPTPAYSLTRGELGFQLAVRMGDVVHNGTATAGAAGTLTDTSMVDADDARIKGAWLTIFLGVAAGDSRRISAFSANVATATPNFSATPTTTSQYYIHREYAPWEYTAAIRRAQRMIGLASFKPVVDRSQVIGSPIDNGMFYIWTLSTVPDSFTLTGAGAAATQETTQTRVGRAGLKLVSGAGALATVYQDLTRIGRFQGRTFPLRAWVGNNTAAEAQIEIDDGVGTPTTVSNVGSSNWEYLQANRVISNAATRLRVLMRTATGSKTAYFAGLNAPIGHGQEYSLNANGAFVRVNHALGVSETPIPSGAGAGGDDFSRTIPGNAWVPVYETTRRLRILQREGTLDGHVLSIEGWANQPDLTAVGTAWEGNPEILLARAAHLLYASRSMVQDTDRAKQEADQMQKEFSQRLNGIMQPGRWIEAN